MTEITADVLYVCSVQVQLIILYFASKAAMLVHTGRHKNWRHTETQFVQKQRITAESQSSHEVYDGTMCHDLMRPTPGTVLGVSHYSIKGRARKWLRKN